MQPWFTVYIVDNVHPCYSQLKPVSSDQYHVTVSQAQLSTEEGPVFFQVDHCPSAGIAIGLLFQAHLFNTHQAVQSSM